MKIKFMYFPSLLVLLLLSILLTGCSLDGAESFVSDLLYLTIGGVVLIIAITVLVIIKVKKREKKHKAMKEAEIAAQKEMTIRAFLSQNDLEQYSDIFEQNNIKNVFSAIELTDSDLLNMGISILADRKKLNTLIAEKLSATKGPRRKCPSCGSLNIEFRSVGNAGGWSCKDCNKGFTFPKFG